MNSMQLCEKVSCEVVRGKPRGAGDSDSALDRLLAQGRFKIQHIRDGKVIGEYDLPNGITDVGMNKLLDVMFHADAQITTWYIGLINNAGFSALNNADTMGSHAGWAESTDYDEANRVTWQENAASARSITNTTTADFTMNTTVTIKGIFVTSDNTKGGTTGTLWSTAAFGTNVSVVDNDQLKVSYSVSG
jgi:hypothetical protein